MAMRLYLFLAATLVSPIVLSAQERGPDGVYLVGQEVSAPKLLRKIEPEFSEEARAAQVQGTVVFELVVNERGRAEDIGVLSPLGFGLDERAEEAIRKWEFKPGEKNGRPVKIRATVEVNFRFVGAAFDERAEKRRMSYNMALKSFGSGEPKRRARAVETIVKLAGEKYPAAMYLKALWMRDGEVLPKDEEKSVQLILASAEKDYGPAMYEIGRMQLNGAGGFTADAAKGMKSIRDAAVLGSVHAQYFLGSLYVSGKPEQGIAADVARARQYFRLCAAARQPECQVRLAQLLLDQPGRAERHYVQAIAWLELAAEAGSASARQLLDRERPNVTAEQNKRVTGLKGQLAARAR